MQTSRAEFWQSQIGAEHEATRIESFLTGTGNSGEQNSITFEIYNSEKGMEALNECAAGSKSRRFIYLMSAVKFLLAAYTGENSITVGCPLPKGLDTSPSNFVFVKSENEYEASFYDIFDKNLGIYEAAIKHSDVDLAELFEPSDRENEIFDIVVSFDCLHLQNRIKGRHGLEFYFREKFDLSCEIIYDRNRYEKKMITYIADHLAQVFLSISENLDATPASFIFPNANGNFGASKNAEFIDQTALTSVLIRAAGQNRESIAVAYQDQTLSYEALNKLSNRAANWLVYKHIGMSDVVGIVCKSPINISILLLAALKTGATFIVLDYMLPQKRLDQIISDCAISILISDVDQVSLRQECFQVQDVLSDQNDDFKPQVTSNDNYAYVVYTSGSTGTPKGIRIKSRSLLNFILWRNETYAISNQDVILQTLTPSSFDGYLISIFTAMVAGATLVCMEKEERADFGRLEQIFDKYGVTNMSTNPAFVSSIIASGYSHILKNFKAIIMGGQNIDIFVINCIQTQYPKLNLYNEYGPSECCMGVASHQISSTQDRHVIGNAVDNSFIYVLNKKGKILPAGFIGEICIGGICLAECYMNSLEMTKEKFVFHRQTQSMMYHSGDYGYLLDDNELVFVGRNDKLVKVNGYRIDLTEIENALIMIEGIERAIVAARNNATLDAYVVLSKEHGTMDLDDIYEYLIDIFPMYMIPNKFYQISEIFYNRSGKYDMEKIKNCAIEIQRDLSETTMSVNAERLTELLIPICQSVLGIDSIGINDNFFELGGNSLSAIRVIAELEEKNIMVEDIDAFLKYQTIQELSLYLDTQIK